MFKICVTSLSLSYAQGSAGHDGPQGAAGERVCIIYYNSPHIIQSI